MLTGGWRIGVSAPFPLEPLSREWGLHHLLIRPKTRIARNSEIRNGDSTKRLSKLYPNEAYQVRLRPRRLHLAADVERHELRRGATVGLASDEVHGCLSPLCSASLSSDQITRRATSPVAEGSRHRVEESSRRLDLNQSRPLTRAAWSSANAEGQRRGRDTVTAARRGRGRDRWLRGSLADWGEKGRRSGRPQPRDEGFWLRAN